MTEQKQTSRVGRGIVLTAAAAVLIGGTVFAAVQMNGGATSPAGTESTTSPDQGDEMKPTSITVLEKSMGGQEAIDALGDDLAAVAKKNNMTEEELTELLQTSETAQISKTGNLFYKDPAPDQG